MHRTTSGTTTSDRKGFGEAVTAYFCHSLQHPRNVNSVVRYWSAYPPQVEQKLPGCLTYTLEALLFRPVELELRPDSVSLFRDDIPLRIPLSERAAALDPEARRCLRFFRWCQGQQDPESGTPLDFFDIGQVDTVAAGKLEAEDEEDEAEQQANARHPLACLRSFRHNDVLEKCLRRDRFAFNFMCRTLMRCLDPPPPAHVAGPVREARRAQLNPFCLFLNCLMHWRGCVGELIARKYREQLDSADHTHFAPGVDDIRRRGMAVLFGLDEVLRREDLYQLLWRRREELLATQRQLEGDRRAEAVRLLNRALYAQPEGHEALPSLPSHYQLPPPPPSSFSTLSFSPLPLLPPPPPSSSSSSSMVMLEDVVQYEHPHHYLL